MSRLPNLALALAALAGRATPQDPPDPLQGRVPIHVRRAAAEGGAAGVAVRVFDALDGRWYPEKMPLEMVEHMRRFLPSTTSDPGGVAWVPEPSGRFFVLGIAEGWFGVASGASLADLPLELELLPDPVLRVKVLDHDRQPAAGTKVALLGTEKAEYKVLELVACGPDGVAALHPGRWRAGRFERVFAAAASGDPEARTADLDTAHLPAEPVELVLRPSAILEATLLDAEGRAVEASGSARLEPRGLPAGSFVAALRSFLTAPFEHGRARFERVPIGIDCAVHPDAQGVLIDEDEALARLETAGERREARFSVTGTALGLRVRLLRAPGEPLAETPVFVRRSDEPRDAKGFTDARGFLTWWAGPPGSKHDGDVRLELATAAPGEHRWASVTFRPEGPRLHELPELVLAPAPLLAAGTVVDERGQPLVRAEVKAYEIPAEGVASARQRARPALTAETDADGRFALHGALEGPFLLDASHWRAPAGERVTVEPGRTDVRLALTRTGTIEARVRFDEGKDAGVVFQAFDTNGRVVLARASMENGVHRIEGLQAGEYMLRCKWGEGGGTVLAEVPGIVVRAGETARDPRCDPLDLAGKVHAIELELRAASGPVPASVYAVVHEHGGERVFAASDTAVVDGRKTLRSPWPTVDLELRAPGMRALELTNVTGAARATFEPGVPVQLALDAAALEVLGERELVVRLTYEGSPFPRPEAFARFDRAGRAETVVCDPGRYNLLLELGEPRAGKDAPRKRSASPQRVDVREGASEPTTIDLGIEYVRQQLGL